MVYHGFALVLTAVQSIKKKIVIFFWGAGRGYKIIHMHNMSVCTSYYKSYNIYYNVICFNVTGMVKYKSHLSTCLEGVIYLRCTISVANKVLLDWKWTCFFGHWL